MDLIATLQVMLRRWYVVVPALLLTGIAVLLVYVAIRPTYQATGTVILRGAAQGEDPKTGARNQYADYGNLSIPARVVAEALSQPTYREKLEKAGVPGKYEAAVDAGSLAPIITVTGDAATPAEAIRTTRAVMQAVANELTERQVKLGAPRVTFLTTEVVASPTEAEPRNGSRLRAAAGVLVLGMIVTLVLGFVAEAVARRQNRAEAEGSAAEAEAGAATPEPEDGAEAGAGARVKGEAGAAPDSGADGEAEAFQCGLCGRILPADEIVDHLTEAHSLPSHEVSDLDALLLRDHEATDLEETEPPQARRLRSAGS